MFKEKKRNPWIIRPSVIFLGPTILGLLLFFINGELYYSWVNEKNWAYFNIHYFFVLLGCYFVFFLGESFFNIMPKRKKKRVLFSNSCSIMVSGEYKKRHIFPFLILYVASVTLFVMLFGIMLAYKSFPGHLSNLSIGIARDYIAQKTPIPMILTGIMPLILYGYINVKQNPNQKGAPSLYIMVGLCVVMYFACSALIMQRTLLYNLGLTFAIIYILLANEINENGFAKKVGKVKDKTRRNLIIGLILLLIAFPVLGAYRHRSGKHTNHFAGYTLASYNRFACIISGKLKMPNEGSGYYSLRAFLFPPVIKNSSLFKTIRDAIFSNLPDEMIDQWSNQFRAVKSANLNGKYVWVTLVGSFFLDVGYLFYLIIFILGWFSGFVFWKANKLNSSAFIMLYASIGSSLALAFGPNNLVFPGTFVDYYVIFSIFILEKTKLIEPLKPKNVLNFSG